MKSNSLLLRNKNHDQGHLQSTVCAKAGLSVKKIDTAKTAHEKRCASRLSVFLAGLWLETAYLQAKDLNVKEHPQETSRSPA
jgi:hypothetical protein